MMGLLDKLKKLIREPEPFDPSVFNDPIANKTAWIPAKNGGSNFKTHKMVVSNEQRISFVASFGLKLFCSLFVVIGFVPIIIFGKQFLSAESTGFESGMIFVAIMGLIFIVVGLAMLLVGLKPRVFDRTFGYYWRGYKGPGNSYNPDELAKFTGLHKIHAIQIIKERCRTKNGSYYSYELNLVLDDASRINVIDHGNGSSLSADAQHLAQFLNVPLWNAV